VRATSNQTNLRYILQLWQCRQRQLSLAYFLPVRVRIRQVSDSRVLCVVCVCVCVCVVVSSMILDLPCRWYGGLTLVQYNYHTVLPWELKDPIV
jgi:hypothetical protein